MTDLPTRTRNTSRTSLEVPYRSITPTNRLLDSIKYTDLKKVVNFYQDTSYDADRYVLFFEFIGNNFKKFDTVKSIASKDTFVIVDDTYEGLLTQKQSDEISEWAEENNIQYLIYSSNQALKGKQTYYFNFHLTYKNFDNIDVQNDQTEPYLYPRPKIFLTLNRQARYHRFQIIDHLLENGYINHTLASCNKYEFEILQSSPSEVEDSVKDFYKTNNIFDDNMLYKTLSKESLQRLEKSLPLKIDMEDNTDLNFQQHMPNPSEMFQKTYWSIIGERDFYSNEYLGFTEKVLKALFYYHPFIVVGLPHTLKSLRELGFITFESVIDESYDSIEDHHERMAEIKKQIDFLANKNYSWHYNTYLELLPILEHNRETYQKLNQNYMCSVLVNKVLKFFYQS